MTNIEENPVEDIAYTVSDKEVNYIIEILRKYGLPAISFKDFCKKLQKQWTPKLDLKCGDIVLEFKNKRIFIDAKRRAICQRSIKYFLGHYFLFYFWDIHNPNPDINVLEFMPAKIMKNYHKSAMDNNKGISTYFLPKSGDPGYRFNPKQLYSAKFINKFIEEIKTKYSCEL